MYSILTKIGLKEGTLSVTAYVEEVRLGGGSRIRKEQPGGDWDCPGGMRGPTGA